MKPVPSKGTNKGSGDKKLDTLKLVDNNAGKPEVKAPASSKPEAKVVANTATDLPKTGESNNVFAWLGIMILAVVASVVFFFKKEEK